MVVNVSFLLKLYIHHWYTDVKKLEDKRQNDQSIRSVEKARHIYETDKNTVMPHGRHIYSKEYDMAKATMCKYPQSGRALLQ